MIAKQYDWSVLRKLNLHGSLCYYDLDEYFTKGRPDHMKKIFCYLLICSFFIPIFFGTSVYAFENPAALILTSSEKNFGKAKAVLMKNFEISAQAIDIDYDEGTILPMAGEPIPLKSAFNKKGIKDTPVHQYLKDEYDSDVIISIWFKEEKSSENKAWNLTNVEGVLYVAYYDFESGRVIHLTEMPSNASGEDSQKAHEQAVAAKLTSMLTKTSEDVLAKLGSFDARQNRIRVQIDNMNEDEYLANGQALIDLMRGLASVKTVKELYSPELDNFVLKLRYTGRRQDLYLAIYKILRDSEKFGNYSIQPSIDEDILIERLDLSKKSLIVKNISQDSYHDTEQALSDLLKDIEVHHIDWKYIIGINSYNSQIEFSFEQSGSIEDFEKTLWLKLQKNERFKNFKLVNIANNTITYESAYQPGDWHPLAVGFNNINPENFRLVGTSIDTIVKSLEGVRNFIKKYNQETQYLFYTFETTRSALDMDTIIWKKIKAVGELKDIVQDNSSGNLISYFYAGAQAIGYDYRIILKNLAPEEYQKKGVRFIDKVKALSGVSNTNIRYDEGEKVLTITFENESVSIDQIDEAIWKAVAEDENFENLAMGSVNKNTINYYFPVESSDLRANEISVYLTKIYGQKYNLLGPAFKALLLSIEGISQVNYSYNLRTKTIAFNATVMDISMGEIDEAISLLMQKDEALQFISPGPSYGRRLVYRYYAKQLAEKILKDESSTGVDKEQKSPQKESLPDIVAKVDPAIVLILVSTKKGSGHGSGFFVDKQGYIITNNHVINQATSIAIQTYNGTRMDARVITTDPTLDLALLKVKSPRKDFPFLPIGKSKNLKKGEQIILMGTPLHQYYQNSVVIGIISGFDRQKGRIQISAPMFPGNSGGPVMDYTGHVIGVNVAGALSQKYVSISTGEKETKVVVTQTEENISFIIPIDYAVNLLNMVK